MTSAAVTSASVTSAAVTSAAVTSAAVTSANTDVLCVWVCGYGVCCKLCVIVCFVHPLCNGTDNHTLHKHACDV